ncbi:MAG: hypothetical protein ACO1QR_12600 [Chthoniobacteraceae bacterium]
MDLLYDGAGWVFGPGENKEGHSFTFTAEANPPRQLLTSYWHSRAPSLRGWTFYAAKQAAPGAAGNRLSFDSMKFNPLEFWLSPYVDEQSECIDLAIWHPAFPKIEHRNRWTAIFLMLDEALGELGTQSWIGEIKISDQRLAESMPLTELPGFVESTVAQHSWKLATPGNLWTCYELKKPTSGVLRGDIIAGSTCLYDLVQDTEDGHIEEDPLEGTGADFMYITLPREMLTNGKELDERGALEEAIRAVLEPQSGRLLGGATGYDYAYIDLMIYDGSTSIALIEQVLRKSRFIGSTTIEYFAKARSAERLVV